MRKVPQDPYHTPFVRISLPAADLVEKRPARHGTPKEALDEIAGRLFAAARENQLAEAAAHRLVHDVRSERRDHVERDYLRPHVSVVSRRVPAGDVLERSGELRPLDVTHRGRVFHLLPEPE